MLKYKQKSQFENPSRSICLDGAERYTDVRTGQSTEHAKKVAENYSNREALKDIVTAQTFPAKEDLDWLSFESPYEVKSTDTKGALDIIKRISGDFFTKSKLNDPNYMRIAYYNMMNHVKTKLGGKSTVDGKPFDINFLETGDKVFVKDGLLFFIRKAESKFASFGVPLYPWGAAAAATTPAPAAPAAPAPTPGGVTPGGAPSAPAPAPATPTRPPRIGE